MNARDSSGFPEKQVWNAATRQLPWIPSVSLHPDSQGLESCCGEPYRGRGYGLPRCSRDDIALDPRLLRLSADTQCGGPGQKNKSAEEVILHGWHPIKRTFRHTASI